MGFSIREGKRAALCYGAREPEAVKIAIANLEEDLKKVLPGVQVIRHETASGAASSGAETTAGAKTAPAAAVAVLPDAGQEDAVIVIRTLTDEEKAQPGICREELADENGVLHKETYQWKVQDGVLYITGSDRRGTIYGIYTFCEWMGVSPWYFFADVPVRKKRELRLDEGERRRDWPSVEYRGIFINDEEELEEWVQGYMGEPTIGVKSYEKIFELLLRLKANYIWPAMHVNSFNLTPENGALAERMGIVVGTSHCDMLMRSNNREWKPWIRKKGYEDAVYDYSIEGRNREILKEYWRESVEQNRDYEVCYTLGMRGIHDSGFETKNLEGRTQEEIRNAKVELLEKIIADQREILRDTLGHGTMTTFIPYKEVLELYDNGLEIPEDMTLVWANDNYGYIRRYPSEKEKMRSGGNGIYYHNSYWAPPSMSYVFLCSIPLAHTRNELQKAWNEGIRKLWVLNSGAMKPLEQEITFFLRLAWEIGKPGALTENVEDFVEDWINRMFTGKIGRQVSELLNDFSQLTNVRKVENMDYDAFSQTAYGDEAALRIRRCEELFERGNELYGKLPGQERDAFFQLVLMRIHAAYFTNLAYYYGDRSTLMYDRGNGQAAALYTEKSRACEDARRSLLHYYNHVMCAGKWNGILNPEGFPPPRAAMMPVCTPPLKIEGEPSVRVDVWNQGKELCFATAGEKWIEIGNTGTGEVEVKLEAPKWAVLSQETALVRAEKRILVRVEDVSCGRAGEIVVKSRPLTEDPTAQGGKESLLRIPVRVQRLEEGVNPCAVEEDGLVVLEAGRPSSGNLGLGSFRRIPRLGRMQGELMEVCARGKADPLCYEFVTSGKGNFLLEIHRFPSLNSVGRIRIGVSLDAGEMRTVESFSNDEWRGNWKKNVLNNVDRLYLELSVEKPGRHCLYVWPVDPYFAFSRMVIYTQPRKENNLAGIKGTQPLPREWDILKWCGVFYGKYDPEPRPVFYAERENDNDTLTVTCRMEQAQEYAKKVKPAWYLEQGNKVFGELDGAVRIEAAAALAQSRFAWSQEPENGTGEGTQNPLWRHCGSESHGRTGLAMYIRTPELSWQAPEAPSLNYRISCRAGEYTLWMLSKFNVQEEGVFAIGIDGQMVPSEQIYGGGRLWRYEAEQIYRWVPAADLRLEAGEHVLQIYALSSGMRYDRFYLTRGQERPPMDERW